MDPRSEVRVRLARHFLERLQVSDGRVADSDARDLALEWLTGDWPHLSHLLDWAADVSDEGTACDSLWETVARSELILNRADPQTVERWCTAQLRVAERLASPELEARACYALGSVLIETPGEFARGKPILERAMKLSLALDDARLYARVLVTHASAVRSHQQTLLSGDSDTLGEWIRSLAEALEESRCHGPETRALLLITLAAARSYVEAERPQGRRDLDEAATLAPTSADPFLEIRWINAKLALMAITTPLEEREQIALRLLELSERFLCEVTTCRSAVLHLAAVSFERGDMESAERWIDRLRDSGTADDLCRYWEGVRCINAGRFETALDLSIANANSALQDGYARERVIALTGAVAFAIAFVRGDVATCSTFAEGGLALFPNECPVALRAAVAFALADRPRDARLQLERARPFSVDES